MTFNGRDLVMAAVGCMAIRHDWQVQGDAITVLEDPHSPPKPGI